MFAKRICDWDWKFWRMDGRFYDKRKAGIGDRKPRERGLDSSLHDRSRISNLGNDNTWLKKGDNFGSAMDAEGLQGDYA